MPHHSFITSDYRQVPCSDCGSLVTVPRKGYPVIRCSPLGYGHRVTVVHTGRHSADVELGQ